MRAETHHSGACMGVSFFIIIAKAFAAGFLAAGFAAGLTGPVAGVVAPDVAALDGAGATEAALAVDTCSAKVFSTLGRFTAGASTSSSSGGGAEADGGSSKKTLAPFCRAPIPSVERPLYSTGTSCTCACARAVQTGARGL